MTNSLRIHGGIKVLFRWLAPPFRFVSTVNIFFFKHTIAMQLRSEKSRFISFMKIYKFVLGKKRKRLSPKIVGRNLSLNSLSLE